MFDDVDDLEPPMKWVPLIVETTSYHLVWVEDYSDRGAEDLADYHQGTGDYDLHKNGHVIDGSYGVSTLDSWQWNEAYYDQHGPWRLCPAPGCTTQEYPSYHPDPVCMKHRVIGCQHMRLPEKVIAA